ncbi:MAG: T9SS type A sorting domain-containing protein [Chitinophagales bacterium]
MKKATLLFASCFLHASLIFSQSPVVSWQQSFGGSSDDFGNDIQLTSDGGLIVGGSTNSTNGDLKKLNHGQSSDFWIMKLGVNHKVKWSKTYGGSDNENLFSIQQTMDGGYIAVGSSESIDGDVTEHEGTGVYPDLWMVKLDANGVIEWQKSIGEQYADVANSVQQTVDGGYIVAGFTNGNSVSVGQYWVIKLDASGNILWDETYGGTNTDVATSVLQTQNGEYIVGGYSYSDNGDVTGHHGSGPSSDCWLVKLDASGNLIWEKSLGGSSNDVANAIRQTNDGAFIFAGYTFSTQGDVTGNHGGADYWLVKVSDAGELLWQHCYGGSNNDFANDIELTEAGGYLITGTSLSNNGDVTIHYGAEDFWLIETDNNGDIIWENTFGGTNTDHALAFCSSPGGSQYVIGSSKSTNNDAVGNNGYNDLLLLQVGNVPVNTISLPVVSDNKPCWGEDILLDFTATGTFNVGNVFTAEITKKDVFTKVYKIGSVVGTGSGELTATIPFDLNKGDHSLRIVSSDPPIVSDALMNGIFLRCPGIPTEGRTTSNITATTAKITWKPSGGCPISYKVKWRIASGNNSDNNFADVTDTTYVLTGLTPNTTYIWQVATLCVEEPELLTNYSLIKEFTTSPLRLNATVWSNGLEIFPNPVQNTLSIKSEIEMNATIEVRNLIGEILMVSPLNASETHLDVSSFSAGSYVLLLKTDTETIVRKFVKE